MNIVVREIKNEDKESIDEMFEELLDDYGCNYGIGHGYPKYIYDKIFTSEKSYNAFVAVLLNQDREETRIVGYIMLEINKTMNQSHIQGLFIEKEYRRRGIARRLVEETENYSKRQGIKTISADAKWEVFTKLYRNMGYSIISSQNSVMYRIGKMLEIEKKQSDELEL